MTIEELKQEKELTCKHIAELISGFNNKTGCAIEEVTISGQRYEDGKKTLVGVRIVVTV